MLKIGAILNIKFLFACLCITLVTLASCTTKKDRLAADTLTIAIDPSSFSVSTGTAKTLTAICRSPKSDDVNISPDWTVDPVIGTLSSASGKTTEFTAGASVGTAKIRASYSGITAVSDVSITSSAVIPIVISQGYGIYSETFIVTMLKFDTANPPDTDGGCMGSYDGVVGNVGSANGANEFTEGIVGLKCSAVGTSGGIWIQFGSDSATGYGTDAKVQKDLSVYTGGTLKFDIRTTAEVTIGMEYGALGTPTKPAFTLTSLGYLTDDSWQQVSILLSSFTSDLTAVQVPVSFFAAAGTVFYIDNVRLEK